eukprot:1154234-Pelagomonas_calceolata.AAC.5
MGCTPIGTILVMSHVGLSFCAKALSKGRYGSSLIGINASRNKTLLEQGAEVPGNISRAIPYCFA